MKEFHVLLNKAFAKTSNMNLLIRDYAQSFDLYTKQEALILLEKIARLGYCHEFIVNLRNSESFVEYLEYCSPYDREKYLCAVFESNAGCIISQLAVDNAYFKSFVLKYCIKCEDSGAFDNMLGYLASECVGLFEEVAEKIMRFVFDPVFIVYERFSRQFVYMKRMAAVCRVISETGLTEGGKRTLQTAYLEGVGCYIDHADANVKQCGMKLVEIVTRMVHEKPIDFGIGDEVLGMEARELVDVFEKCGMEGDETGRKVDEAGREGEVDDKWEEVEERLPPALDDDEEEIDLKRDAGCASRKLFKDPPNAKVKRPKFIRQCLEYLRDSEEPRKSELAIEELVSLIKKSSTLTLKEMGAEIAKDILFWQNHFNLESFHACRDEAMPLLISKQPQCVNCFLGAEFYTRHVNLTQRFEILAWIVLAAKKMCGIDVNSNTGVKMEVTGDDWKESKRLVTRKIKSTETFANPLYSSLETFVLPFIRPLWKQSNMKLLLKNIPLLVKLVHSVAVVLYLGHCSPAVVQVGREYLDFLSSILCYTPHPDISRALVFGYSVCFQILPKWFWNEYDGTVTFQEWVKTLNESPDKYLIC